MKSVTNPVKDSVAHSVWTYVNNSVWEPVASVWHYVAVSVNNSVWEPVANSVVGSVWNSL